MAGLRTTLAALTGAAAIALLSTGTAGAAVEVTGSASYWTTPNPNNDPLCGLTRRSCRRPAR